MILFLIKLITDIKQKQLTWLSKSERSTRRNENGFFDEKTMGGFCTAVDNNFMLPKVMAVLCEKNFGVVGKARYRKRLGR